MVAATRAPAAKDVSVALREKSGDDDDDGEDDNDENDIVADCSLFTRSSTRFETSDFPIAALVNTNEHGRGLNVVRLSGRVGA